MLNLAISELRLVAKKRNINSYTDISRKIFEDVLSKKPTFLLRSIKREPLMKIDEFQSIHKDYKPKKIADVFNGGHSQYKCEGSVSQIEKSDE